MRKLLFIILYCFISLPALADGFFYPLQNGQVYFRGFSIPLVFKDTNNGKQMELNEEGLFWGKKKLCYWTTPATSPVNHSPENAFNLVFDKYCPVDSPVIATWGDAGTGTAAIFVRVEKENDETVAFRFRGYEYVINRNQLKDYVRYVYNETSKIE